MLTLQAGDWRLALDPALGGSAAALTWRGEDVLRRTPSGTSDPLQTACFPLVPFANRIANGHFSFQGKEVRLPVLDAFAPHALHGFGWRMPWRGEQAGPDRASMTCSAPAGDWPWAWSARQDMHVRPGSVVLQLSLTNDSDTPMPAGLGFHPYFLTGPDSRIAFAATSVWLTGEDEIPSRVVPARDLADWSGGPRIADRPPVDHCYADWSGGARIDTVAGPVTLMASGRRLHVFTPRGAGYACLEPVTHRPDAVHGAAGEMPVLGPGEATEIWMAIQRDQPSA